LDAGAAEAARAAVANPARAGAPVSNRSKQLPRSDEIPKVGEADDDEAATRAVPREDYFRSQDAHVVVGNDAVGDDATLAVAPEDNEARNQRMAAFAQTMMSPESLRGAFPPPPAGTFPHSPPVPMQTPQPHSGWQDPHQHWSPSGSTSVPIHPAGPPSNPHVPPSIGAPMVPMHQPMQGYPVQHSGQPQHGQLARGPTQGGTKLPKQFIVLAVVGIVCVAIFITGIVLFATTKF
jgi:hypothetical protein